MIVKPSDQPVVTKPESHPPVSKYVPKLKSVQIHKKQNKYSAVIVIIAVCIIIYLGLCFFNDLHRQKEYHEIFHQHKVSQCVEQYKIAQCDDPVDELRQHCAGLRNCHLEHVGQTTMITGLVSKSFNAVLNHLGWLGTIFVIVIAIVMLVVCLKECTRIIVIKERYD